jgi:hypothetical protein
VISILRALFLWFFTAAIVAYQKKLPVLVFSSQTDGLAF